MKKTLVIVVILLFLSFGFSSGISAELYSNRESNIELKNNDLQKITVSICKINEIENHTIMLTQEEVNQLDLIIENIKL